MNIFYNILYLLLTFYVFIFIIFNVYFILNPLYDLIYIFLFIILIIIIYITKYKINHKLLFVALFLIFINILVIFFTNLSKEYISITVFMLYYIYIIISLNKLELNNYIKIIILSIVLLIYFISINLLINRRNKSYDIKLIKNLQFNENHNLKVALCVSGRIDKNMEKIYINWKKNLLDHYNVDIFMNINETNDFINNVIKPKKCVIFNENINIDNLLDKNSNLMFYRIYECNKYSIEYENKNNFKYDIIIRTRSDVMLNKKLYLSSFNENYVYFPVLKDKFEQNNNYGSGVTDQLFLANRENMNKITDIYLHLDKKNFKIDCKIPEVTLYYYLRMNKINILFFYYNWNINYYSENNFYNKLKLFSKIFLITGKDCLINIK